MKALKLNCTILLIVALVFSSASIFAQQEDNQEVKKEVVIIKKTVDEDGNVQVTRIVKSADTEDILTEDVSIESAEGDDIEVFEFETDGAENIHMIELEGLEGLSDETLEKLKDIHVDIHEDTANRRVKIIMDKDEDGSEPVIIEWQGTGEIPEDIKMKMQESGVIWNGDIDQDSHGYAFASGLHEGNKACLGVMIGKTVENENGVETVHGESELGVTVLDVIDNSGAKDAGLLKDDIITAINGSSVVTIQDVLDVLKPFEGGETVSIDYLRNNQPTQVNATLKTCENKMEIKRFKSLEGNTFEFEDDMNWVEESEEAEGDSHSKRIVIIKKRENGSDEVVVEKTIVKEDKLAKTDTPDEVVNSTESVDKSLELQDFSLFPNPTAGNLNVEFRSEAVPTTVKVFDITGKEVYREELTDFDGIYKKEINLGNVPKGTLMLTVSQNDKVFAEKIVVQ